MKKLSIQLTALMLVASVAATHAQWNNYYNAPPVNGVLYHDVANDVLTDYAGNTYVAGTVDESLNSQDVRLIKYSPNGNQLAAYTHNSTGHKETVKYMLMGKDSNLYVITSADEVGNNLNYIKIMKYNRSLQFLMATTFSSPVYYIPTGASFDPAGNLYVSCTKKNPMGGTGELAVLKINTNGLAHIGTYTYAYQFAGDGYHVNAESVFAETGAVYVCGYIMYGGASDSRPFLTKINTSNMTAAWSYFGLLAPNRNAYASVIAKSNHVFVAGTLNGNSIIALKIHKTSGSLINTFTFAEWTGFSGEGVKIDNINDKLYLAGYSYSPFDFKYLRFFKLSNTDLQPTQSQSQSFNNLTDFKDMIFSENVLMTTGTTPSNGYNKMFTSLLNLSGVNWINMNPSTKGSGMALTKKPGSVIATGWADDTNQPVVVDKKFVTQLIPDAAITRLAQNIDNTDVDDQLLISVLPNPSSEQIVVKGLVAASLMTVTDMQGKTVVSAMADENGSAILVIDKFRSGVYTVINEGAHAKFVKQ